jgi:hypothetical protein
LLTVGSPLKLLGDDRVDLVSVGDVNSGFALEQGGRLTVIVVASFDILEDEG